jgi:catechol 2,3-dioxygenase-like lactoylglutathione lyase family enzyme
MAAKSSVEIDRFTTITLQVSDLERSLHFYRDGLGLSFNPQSSDNAIGASVGEVFLLLHKDFEPGLESKERGLGIELHFGISDADAYFAELKERGISPLDEPKDQPWGRVFSVTDPDGYAIEFVAPKA